MSAATETIWFRREFLSGVLAGLVGPVESVSFPESARGRYARRFARGVEGRCAVTRTRYRIVDAAWQHFGR